MSLQWYVVHAYSGFENQVKRALEERIAREDMADSFGEILVPTEEVVEMREGNKRRSERKFFPGYVLVQMDMNEDTWHLVKDAPKVLGFIGDTTDRPAPITQREADAILQRVQEGVDKPRPKVLFEVGEVCLPDAENVTGSRTEQRLAAIFAAADSGFSEIHTALDMLLYYLSHEYKLRPADFALFIAIVAQPVRTRLPSRKVRSP